MCICVVINKCSVFLQKLSMIFPESFFSKIYAVIISESPSNLFLNIQNPGTKLFLKRFVALFSFAKVSVWFQLMDIVFISKTGYEGYCNG